MVALLVSKFGAGQPHFRRLTSRFPMLLLAYDASANSELNSGMINIWMIFVLK